MPDGANSWTGFTNGQVWGGFDRPVESAYRTCMETVTGLDRAIGRLTEHLEERDLLQDTVLAYASDNGFLFGEHEKVELRWPFEEVIRIPFLVRFPAEIRNPGTRVTRMVLNIDVAPTFLDLAGIPIPDHVQGTSLVPALRDPSRPGRKAWLVENYKEFPYRVPSYQGVRTERYVYVDYEGSFAPTLHDLAADPKQTRDLFGSREGNRVVAELKEMLAALRSG
jgi:N-acetylglucosamine-6-sulfatase